jgi:oligosaccharyltransferase complex subunit alpha (ribophorin I)
LTISDYYSGVWFYSAALPKPLKVNESITVELETVLTHATYPWPAKIAQGDDLAVKHETDLFVLSPYKTLVQRTKVR